MPCGTVFGRCVQISLARLITNRTLRWRRFFVPVKRLLLSGYLRDHLAVFILYVFITLCTCVATTETFRSAKVSEGSQRLARGSREVREQSRASRGGAPRGGPKNKYKDLTKNKEPLFSFRSLYFCLGPHRLFLFRSLYLFLGLFDLRYFFLGLYICF